MFAGILSVRILYSHIDFFVVDSCWNNQINFDMKWQAAGKKGTAALTKLSNKMGNK